MLFRSIIALALAMKTSATLVSNSIFTPQRISHAELISNDYDPRLLETLSNDGIVSITDIPGFNEKKNNLMRHLHACLTDMDNKGEETINKNEYNDGTVRRTMASVTIPGPGGARPFDYDESSANCQEFNKDVGAFRKMVDSTTDEFAVRLSNDMGSALQVPLMTTEHGEYAFDEFKDVVRYGSV